MDKYLIDKCKGKYRVYAHYDLKTLDFPRDYEGNIDASFGDFYLKGKYDVEIKHAYNNILTCYVPSLTRGKNFIVKYYNKIYNKNIKGFNQRIVEELKNDKYIDSVDILDFEVLFTFNIKYLDIINEIVHIKTSGANISPFSVKNLPKKEYEIPKSDLETYKTIIKHFNANQILTYGNNFFKDILQISNANFLIKKERLKRNQWIHKNGYWDEWIKYLRSQLEEA